MKAGKVCVSAIFRPVPSVAMSGEYAHYCWMFRGAYMSSVLLVNEKVDDTKQTMPLILMTIEVTDHRKL